MTSNLGETNALETEFSPEHQLRYFSRLGSQVNPRYFTTFAQSGQTAKTAGVAVGPQYDTTHVYVAPQDFDRFVASLIATFGGTTTKQGVFTVTPTPSSTMSQLVLTPVGTISVFGFKTPVPYPFGLERTGYLVTDMDEAIRRRQGNGRRRLGRCLQRSHRSRRDHSMARWREHATVLAHHRAILCSAPNYSRESGLCLTRPSGCICAKLCRLFPRDGRL